MNQAYGNVSDPPVEGAPAAGVPIRSPREWCVRHQAPDYEPAGLVEATSPYAAFFAMRETPEALEVGDVLEAGGALRILKFVGFEEAQWVLPEAKPPAGAVSEDTGNVQFAQ
ncbi:MAG: hypothetical protein WDO18_04690 [Acidobacteriota bacterium]